MSKLVVVGRDLKTHMTQTIDISKNKNLQS